MYYLENIRQVSQVEDVVEAYRRGEKVLADFLMQTDSCLDEQNKEMDKCRDGWVEENHMDTIMDWMIN